MQTLFSQLTLDGPVVLALAGGGLVGNLIAKWTTWLCVGTFRLCPHCQSTYPWSQHLPLIGPLSARGRCRDCAQPVSGCSILLEFSTALLFAAFTIAYRQFDCQATAEVLPDAFWQEARLLFHLLLLGLLVAATATDLRDYTIPDAITVPGMLLAVALATTAGDLQMIHIWVDWSLENRTQHGPFLPGWISTHPHLHGLAWSLAGLTAGALLTGTARWIASRVLGREALGLGDVTLMAMIGSFVGWQPVVFVFLLAPFCGLLMALTVRVLHGRSYIPYGPFLAAATAIVLFFWGEIWMWQPTATFRLRDQFGDPVGLAMISSTATVLLLLLLGSLRVLRGASDVTLPFEIDESNGAEEATPQGDDSARIDAPAEGESVSSEDVRTGDPRLESEDQ